MVGIPRDADLISSPACNHEVGLASLEAAPTLGTRGKPGKPQCFVFGNKPIVNSHGKVILPLRCCYSSLCVSPVIIAPSPDSSFNTSHTSVINVSRLGSPVQTPRSQSSNFSISL